MRLLALAFLLPSAVLAGERSHKPLNPMLSRIDPTAKQRADLSALARRADAARARLEKEKEATLPPFLDALRKLREEVVGDRGLDPATTKAASSLKARLKDAHTRFLKELEGIEEEALVLLTPAQRARAGLDRSPPPARGELEELERELAEVHAELYGEAGPLGRLLATPGAAEALGAGRATPPRRDIAPWEPLEREARQLRHEINLWNLVNGLHLAEPQLATVARTARQGRDASARVLAALSPEQKDVLFTYKACLVPPRNLRDPVRAGQANDSSATEQLLARLRRLPERRYAANEERILDATLDGIEAREGRFSPDDRPFVLLALARAVRKVRAMGDVEFQARVAECAEALAPLYRHKDLKEELRDRTGRDAVLRQKAEAFLLDPAMTRVCERRLAQLRAGDVIAPKGPIERAPACPGEGECGRP